MTQHWYRAAYDSGHTDMRRSKQTTRKKWGFFRQLICFEDINFCIFMMTNTAVKKGKEAHFGNVLSTWSKKGVKFSKHCQARSSKLE